MLNVILFRGGMFGDLLLGMVDPTALLETSNWQLEYKHSTCANYNIKYCRTFQKKFGNYTETQKQKYYDRFSRIPQKVYVLTHDTDFSWKYTNITTQIICSDYDMIHDFATRFKNMHRQKVIIEANSMIENKRNFVNDYSESIKLWQDAFVFPNRFDIKNIHNKTLFLQDCENYFGINDMSHAERIYDNHIDILQKATYN